MRVPMQGAAETVADAVRDSAIPLRGAPSDLDPIVARAAAAPIVLLGEASHGTHEFYRLRAEITKRLVRELGVRAVAIEGDWPDAYRVNRWVRGEGGDADADEALSGFRRFPQWMWRNADVLDFAGWLRAHNERIPDPARRVGFYGLDLYSLHASMEAVLDYLDAVDPDAAARARRRYGCFDQFDEDPQGYGYAASHGLTPSCEREAVAQLVDLRAVSAARARRAGHVAADDGFVAEMNARVVRNAERYYRAMFGSRVTSWNLRDLHMAETLDALVAFLAAAAPGAGPPRVVVWAHNSHLGDARATEMGATGEVNLGQLVRQHRGAEALLVGFSTHEGTVTAADDWGAPARRMTLRRALPGSCEALLHEAGPGDLLLDLSAGTPAARLLEEPRLQRAIGVIYRPHTERASHYFRTELARQFDLLLHLDVTRAVEPLERTPLWGRGEAPETFPTAL